jgi:hypothetical protein
MSEKLKESLSAVIDGEADEFELRRVLDEVGKDMELQRSWDRYHLIGSVMRGERVSGYHAMRERIWAELHGDELVEVAESAPDQPAVSTSRPPRWGAMAVAAVVVLAAAVGYYQIDDPEEARTPEVAVAGDDGPTRITAGAVDPGPVQTARWGSEISLSDRRRIDAYWVYHNQHLGMNQAGFGGFVRMVSYERR